MAAKNAPKLWDTVNGLTDREWSVFMQLLRSRLDQDINDHVLVSSLVSPSAVNKAFARENLTVMRLVRKGLVRSCAMTCCGITGVYARVTARGVDAYLMLLGDIKVTA